MDQEKIGKFIAEVRKEKNMTQMELSNKLGVTDRAISKWENGRGMPDLSLLKSLCDELDITINELLSGEKISKKDYQEKLEENIINTIDYSNNEIKRVKRKRKNIIISILIMLVIILGFILGRLDYRNIIMGENPNFMIRITDGAKTTQYYIGLGYMMERKVGVSYKEPLRNDVNVRFGLWVFTWDVYMLNPRPDDLYLVSDSSNVKANTCYYCWTDTHNGMSLSECVDTISPLEMEYNEEITTTENDKIYMELKDANISKIVIYPYEKNGYCETWYNDHGIGKCNVDYQVEFNNQEKYMITPRLKGEYIVTIMAVSNKGGVMYSFKINII